MDRSRRNVPCLDYWKIQNGVYPDTPPSGQPGADSGDFVSLFPEGEMSNFDEEDSAMVEEMLNAEAAEVKELEAKARSIQLQEEEKRRRRTMDLSKLQAMRERKALLQRIVAGEVPPSSLRKQSRDGPAGVTPQSTPQNSCPAPGAAAMSAQASTSNNQANQQHPLQNQQGGEFKDL